MVWDHARVGIGKKGMGSSLLRASRPALEEHPTSLEVGEEQEEQEEQEEEQEARRE
jgi:hypothetical protein